MAARRLRAREAAAVGKAGPEVGKRRAAQQGRRPAGWRTRASAAKHRRLPDSLARQGASACRRRSVNARARACCHRAWSSARADFSIGRRRRFARCRPVMTSSWASGGKRATKGPAAAPRAAIAPNRTNATATPIAGTSPIVCTRRTGASRTTTATPISANTRAEATPIAAWARLARLRRPRTTLRLGRRLHPLLKLPAARSVAVH